MQLTFLNFIFCYFFIKIGMIITLYINRTNTQNAASFKENGKTKSQYESKKKKNGIWTQNSIMGCTYHTPEFLVAVRRAHLTRLSKARAEYRSFRS